MNIRTATSEDLHKKLAALEKKLEIHKKHGDFISAIFVLQDIKKYRALL